MARRIPRQLPRPGGSGCRPASRYREAGTDASAPGGRLQTLRSPPEAGSYGSWLHVRRESAVRERSRSLCLVMNGLRLTVSAGVLEEHVPGGDSMLVFDAE